MGLLEKLSSRSGSRTQDANVAVAARCLAKPDLLAEIVQGLADADARLAGDCAEVMTKVAEQAPSRIAPHAAILLRLLMNHRNGRVRWESAHALALVSSQAPRVVEAGLPALCELARKDKSVIVRDYVFDAISGYASTGPKAARAALPILIEGLDLWGSKHAGRILAALASLADTDPTLAGDLAPAAARFASHTRSGVRKAAERLQRAVAAAPTRGRRSTGTAR